jgi:ELWxxDGT repeat protein
MLKDVMPGSVSSNPSSLVAVNNGIFFVANNGNDGVELWKSDGTTAGTVLVADIAPGAASSYPEALVGADGLVWFAADDQSTGVELWKSDGTAAGTQRVADLVPGSGGSYPRLLTTAGRRFYFTAQTSSGRELWTIALAATAYAIDDVHIAEGNSGTAQLHFRIRRSGDISQPGTVSFATSNGTATAGSDYVAQSGIASFGAGVAETFVDVVVNGDVTSEEDETLFVTIGSASSGVIDRATATGVIEDEDRTADLTVAYVQSVDSSYGRRIFVVTNNGPSTASGVAGCGPTIR